MQFYFFFRRKDFFQINQHDQVIITTCNPEEIIGLRSLDELRGRCYLLTGKAFHLFYLINQQANISTGHRADDDPILTGIFIDGLVKKGLVHRIKDPEDSRISLLSLTSRGQSKLQEINLFLDDVHKQVLLQMPAEQRNTLLMNLDMLKSSMEAVKELMV